MKRLFAGLAVAGLALLSMASANAAPIFFKYGVTVNVPGDTPAIVGSPTFLGPNVFFDEPDSTVKIRPESDITGNLNCAAPGGTDITIFFHSYSTAITNGIDQDVFNVPTTIYLTLIDVDNPVVPVTLTITGDLKATVTTGSTTIQSWTLTSGLPVGPVLVGDHFYKVQLPQNPFNAAGGAGPDPLFGNEGKLSFNVQCYEVPEPGTVALFVGLGISGTILAIRRRRR